MSVTVAQFTDLAVFLLELLADFVNWSVIAERLGHLVGHLRGGIAGRPNVVALRARTHTPHNTRLLVRRQQRHRQGGGHVCVGTYKSIFFAFGGAAAFEERLLHIVAIHFHFVLLKQFVELAQKRHTHCNKNFAL